MRAEIEGSSVRDAGAPDGGVSNDSPAIQSATQSIMDVGGLA